MSETVEIRKETLEVLYGNLNVGNPGVKKEHTDEVEAVLRAAENDHLSIDIS